MARDFGFSAEQQDQLWVRQYLPKNDDLRQFSQEDLDEIADKINTRP